MPKKQISLLIGFVFIDVLGYSLFFPLLPYYAEIFGAGPTLVGLMIASNAAAQFIASPIVGRLSDRFGRRPLLIISIFGTMVSFFLLGLAGPIGKQLANVFPMVQFGHNPSMIAATWTIVMLFFCRVLDGLAGGNVSLARAYISDITDDDNRAKGLGFIGAAFGLGFVIGPAIGGTLSNWTTASELFDSIGLSRFAVPAMATVLISIINLVGVILWLPESLPVDVRNKHNQKEHSMGTLSLKDVLRREKFGSLLLTRFLFSMALILFMANFALYTQYHLGLTDRTTSYVMTYAGVLLIIVQAIGIGWMTTRYQEMNLLFTGLIIITISLAGLIITQSLGMLIIVIFPLATSGSILNTIINSLISKSVKPEEVGGALGLATGAESLTWVLAPTVGGLLIDYLGGWSLGAAGIIITGFLILYTWRNVLKNPEKTEGQLNISEFGRDQVNKIRDT